MKVEDKITRMYYKSIEGVSYKQGLGVERFEDTPEHNKKEMKYALISGLVFIGILISFI